MSFDHYDNLLTCAAAGLGLFLAGVLNLAFGRGGRYIRLRLVVTLVLCGAVLGGLRAFARPELALPAARVLVGVLLVATGLGSEWCTRKLASVVAFFRKPAPRWGLVALSGLGLVIGSGVAFDRADEKTDLTKQCLALEVSHTPSRPTGRVGATTDRGTPIILKEPLAYRNPNELAGFEESALQHMDFGGQVIRRSGPYEDSNCHGWVFTGGKFILAPEDVETILEENGYREVHDPQPGDLVIYRLGGTITHSAVVRYVTEGQPVLIEGKWGPLGVFLHPATKSLYGNAYTFYRSARTGHLLVGLGGTRVPCAEHPDHRE